MHQAFPRGANHLSSVYIVRLAMRAGVSVVVMANVVGEGFGVIEVGGLVHVVPDAGNAIVLNEAFEESRPPVAGHRFGEVREVARARPDLPRVEIAISLPTKVIARNSFLIDEVIGIDLNTGIDDGYGLKALSFEIANDLSRFGERLEVPSEAAVAIHVVDVHVESIAGDLMFKESVRDSTQFFFGFVGPLALVVAESPLGGQLRRAGELGDCLLYTSPSPRDS